MATLQRAADIASAKIRANEQARRRPEFTYKDIRNIEFIAAALGFPGKPNRSAS